MVLSSPIYGKSNADYRFTWDNLTGLEIVRMSLEHSRYFDEVFKGRFPTKYEYRVWLNNIKSNKVSDYLIDAYNKLKEDHPNDLHSIHEMRKAINNYRRTNGLKEIERNESTLIVCLP